MKHSLRTSLLLFLSLLLALPMTARQRTFHLADYGIRPNAPTDSCLANRLEAALMRIRQQVRTGDKVTLHFASGTYHFHAKQAPRHELYISNHDQDNPKAVGVLFDDWQQLTIDGNGAEMMCHGRMIPIVIKQSSDVKVKRLVIDFDNPQIAQVQVVKNSPETGITFEVAPWVRYRINQQGRFETFGENWTLQPSAGIAFERDTHHIVYNTSDLGINTTGCQDLGGRQVLAPQWKDQRLVPGTVVAMRFWERPCPGIVLANNVRTTLQHVTVHYAEGMGLIAQRCDDIKLDGFKVSRRGDDDPRYFTTQADATHFSQCRGKIQSNGGLYEGMMDDAINIHGIYLKVKQRLDDHTLLCSYEHHQAWGFDWGDVGDEVRFVRSATMENVDFRTTIKRITPDDERLKAGYHAFVIEVNDALPAEITSTSGYGIENLTWTPEVEFRRNIVRNNRARGALFSSPRRTVCTDNLFDHTSGTAILLCGDCNGWYESGSVHDLLIARNTFINALTSMFQFTNAVISIYPEIPQLDKQQRFFHGGKAGAITIKNNHFVTFDQPLLYAKSVDGLVFKGNQVKRNADYRPFHWNQKAINLEHCRNAVTELPKEIK